VQGVLAFWIGSDLRLRRTSLRPCRREEHGFDRARCYGLYGGILRTAILEAKFHHRERLARKLGELLIHPWNVLEKTTEGEKPSLIPVPLYSSRQRERGYNQAVLLAEV